MRVIIAAMMMVFAATAIADQAKAPAKNFSVTNKTFVLAINGKEAGRITFNPDAMTSGLWTNRFQMKDDKLFCYSTDSLYVTVFEQKESYWNGKRAPESSTQDGMKFQLKLVADPIVGTWRWSSNITVTCRQDGVFKASNKQQGAWNNVSSNPKESNYDFQWDTGLIDKLSLSPDKKRLTGKNQIGFKITAERVE